MFCLILSMSGLLVLTGCGSSLVDINLPAAVGPSETIDVSVTHVFDDDRGAFLGEGDDAGLIFSIIIPSGWTAAETGTYEGDWGDEPPFIQGAVLLSSAPTSDMIDLLEAVEPPLDPEEIAVLSALDCELTPPVPPAGSKLVWYQIGPPTPDANIQPGDGGTLNVQLTSGLDQEPATITFQHAIYAVNPENPDEAICAFYADTEASTEDDVIQDSIFGMINQFGESATVPVPALGGGMLALLAALLVFVGARIGRKP